MFNSKVAQLHPTSNKCLTTRNKKLLGAPGLTSSNKKLVVTSRGSQRVVPKSCNTSSEVSPNEPGRPDRDLSAVVHVKPFKGRLGPRIMGQAVVLEGPRSEGIEVPL